MVSSVSFVVLILAIIFILDDREAVQGLRRDDFPPSFVFGAGTSAYQVEGAVAEDGRTPSICDTFYHAGRAPDHSNGDIAADGYHKYKEDVKLMNDTGLEAYRFSISWSRLIPNGRGAVNPKGLEYYDNLINELLKHGIQPHITLYHFDLPQVLEDEYKGWLSPKIVDDFTLYADVCFSKFGDRVSHWTTLAEPNILAQAAYDSGSFPPGRCSYPFGTNCVEGDSTREQYVAAHNMLLAHASAVKLYRRKYQALQNGSIGINLYAFGFYPFTNSSADVEATRRASDFIVGWFLHPLVYGNYPAVMRRIVGQRLPSFTEQESTELLGSYDFIGLNFYLSLYVGDNAKTLLYADRDYYDDMAAVFTDSKDVAPKSHYVPVRTPIYPPGLQHLLEYIKQDYGNPPIYIQENGYGLGDRNSLNDTKRIAYLKSYIGGLLGAMRKGSDVRGYFVWSFMDLFEYLSGYTSGMGLYYVDFSDPELRRQPKLSAYWYAKFLKNSYNDDMLIDALHKISHIQ